MKAKLEKGTKIILDEKYYLTPDGYKGLVLNFEELRTKEKTVGNKKTGIFEEYLFNDSWYYPTFSMVLQKYLKLKTVEAINIQELYDKVLFVENKINELNK